MTLYVKLEVRSSDNYSNKLPNFYNWQSKDGSVQTNGSFLTGIWYDFKQYLKAYGVSDQQIKEYPLFSDWKTIYNYVNPTNISSYTLEQLYEFRVYDKNMATDSYSSREIGKLSSSTKVNSGSGIYIIPSKSADYNLVNENSDLFLVFVIGYYSRPLKNSPLVEFGIVDPYTNTKAQGVNSSHVKYDKSVKTSAFMNLDNLQITVPHPTNKKVDVYKNNKLLNTFNLSDNNNVFDCGKMVVNDVISFSNLRDISDITKIYYELPKIEHVTFTPSKIELNKITNVDVSVDTGYKIDNLSFWVDGQNSRIFTATYDNGKMVFDLTHYKETNDDLKLLQTEIKKETNISNRIRIIVKKGVGVDTVTYTPQNPKIGDKLNVTVLPSAGYISYDPTDENHSQILYYSENNTNIDDETKCDGVNNFNQTFNVPIPNTNYTRKGEIFNSLTFSVYGTYVINTVAKKYEIPITNHLPHGKIYDIDTNTKIETEITTLNSDRAYNLHIKADGYTYSNITLTGSYGENVGTVDGTNISIPYIQSTDDNFNPLFGGLTLDGTETQIQVTKFAKVKSDTINPNYTINYQQVEVGKPYNIVVTSLDNYEFYKKADSTSVADKAYIIINGSKQSLLISDDSKTLSCGVPITITNTDDIIIHAETHKIKLDDSDRTKIPIKLNLTHCKSNVSYLLSMGGILPNGQYDIKNTTVTLTADDGFLFNNDVTYYSYDAKLKQYILNTIKATRTGTVTFTMTGGVASDYDASTQGKYPLIDATATKEETTNDGLDSIHLYNMTNSELDDLSNKLISYIKAGPEIASYDYTRFINQVYRLPFSLPSFMLTDTTKVECGLVNLSINTHELTKETYEINVGTIDCLGLNKNSLDYNSLECNLILPYVPSIKLSINDLIDNKLKITYRINLLNGMCTIVIDNDTGNIYTNNISVATNLQIFGSYEDKDIGNLNSVLNNKIRQAYLIISSKKPVNNLTCYPCNDHGTLKNYHGLTKTTNTTINIDGTINEVNDIISQLEKGVIIK